MGDSGFEEMKKEWKGLIDIGCKPFGSANLIRAADYLVERLGRICPDAAQDVYEMPAWEVGDWSLGFVDSEGGELKAYPFLGSGASDGFEGRLRFAGYNRVWNMYVWDRYAVTDPEGEIKAYVTIREGGGAIPQMLFTGTGGLPHFMVGEEERSRILEAVESGARIGGFVQAKMQPDSRCYDVVGSLGDADEKVVLCAHFDTVYNTTGAYDNAAGAAALLETARRLKTYRLKKRVEILLTDGEEFDLRGARARCAKDQEKTAAVINLDGVGRENILEVWSGPESFERKIRTYLDKSSEEFTPVYICPPPPGSDHAPYFEKGIPVCMLTFNDQGILHTPEDVYEESKLANMSKIVRLTLGLMEHLGFIEKIGEQ